jgi:hypothetical protein
MIATKNKRNHLKNYHKDKNKKKTLLYKIITTTRQNKHYQERNNLNNNNITTKIMTNNFVNYRTLNYQHYMKTVNKVN